MQHFGDITKIKGAEVPIVDVITGGSPCQDLSIAGKRAGLAGERSGLFMEQIRVIKEMRDEYKRLRPTRGANEYIRPRYMVWENVPGAFSSNKGDDFRAVLEETAKVVQWDACIPGPPGGKWPYAGCILGDGWSIAWRVHDAQFWGVPQRRKRIALVADFGGESAPEILFERQGVPGDIEESREQGQGVATNSERSVDKTIGVDLYNQTTTENVSKTLNSIRSDSDHVPCVIQNKASKCLNAWDVQSKHIQPENGIAEALYAGECRYAGGESYVLQNKAISFQERAGKPGGGKGILIQDERTGALSTFNNQSVFCLQGNGINRADTAGCNGKGWRENQSYTLNTIDRPAVCYSRQRSDELIENKVASTQSARQYKDATDLVVNQSVIRRLTPLECERLQGYPDGWTDIGEWTDSKEKKHKDADSPRYKALGNSIALPFWKWMAKRMRKYLGDKPTMASLFDGIGGFPLSYTEAGVEPVWASEIEEFPIAVTKIRFPDAEKEG